jgi:uncharacterized protein with PIN domain
MARTIRFHLDECCDPRIAVGLRRLGIDVTMPAEVGLLHHSDEDHFAFCLRERRTIITQDADFLRFHESGRDHPGIFFYQDQQLKLGPIIRGVKLVWEILEPDEMWKHKEYLGKS